MRRAALRIARNGRKNYSTPGRLKTATPATTPALSHHHGSCIIPQTPVRGFSATAARGEEERQWTTPLAKQLTEAINTTGPIPLASYMRMCLTSDIGGYYTGALEKDRDQFGQRGDFITSPEISQIFGELIGIWFVAEWMSQGSPKRGVELIEVGPGRGTLMDDILRTIRNFKDMASSIEAVYMVEASKELRATQKDRLCGEDAVIKESKEGFHCQCKYSDIPIVWTEGIKAIPQGPEKMPFIVAHEFFDALPIHAFQVVEVPPTRQPATASGSPRSASSNTNSTTLQWREMVVSPTPPGTTHADLGTPAAERHDGAPVPEFQMTLSPAATRHALYVPESSARYRALRSTPGALIEVCPDAALYAADFAARIGGSAQHPKPRPAGAALVLDYGPADTVPANTLRGIRRHRRVSPFSEPGRVDLSADVDFVALADAALRASPGVEVHGPVEQAAFLEAMGVRQRAEMLTRMVRERLGGGAAGEERTAEIERAWKRLVDRGPDGMGRIYKALAILPENDGRRRPVGFGGDIAA